jgi:hypothetical protein
MEPHDASSAAASSSSFRRRPPLKRSTTSKKKLLQVYHVILKRGSTTDYIVGIVSHVGAAITALAELGNDVASIGHGHGMLLLVASRLARECNGIRAALVEELEELAHVKLHRTVSGNDDDEEESWWWKWVMNTCGVIGCLLSTQNVASVLAMASLASAALEVIEDAKPGGHHGAVLLAMNELWELMELSDIVPASWRCVLFQQHLLRLCIVSGALVVAVMEVYEDLFPSSNTLITTNSMVPNMGAHHGVAIVAMAKILGVIALMRTEVREIEREEETIMSSSSKED